MFRTLSLRPSRSQNVLRSAGGCLLFPIFLVVPCDCVQASVECDGDGDKTFYDRNQGEALEDFKRRVLATHPKGRISRSLILIPTE
jgi:hypothetical protein